MDHPQRVLADGGVNGSIRTDHEPEGRRAGRRKAQVPRVCRKRRAGGAPWFRGAAWARVCHRVTADPPIAVPDGIRRGSTYFPELESLRGIAIALVVVFHADGRMLMPFFNRIGTSPSPPLAFVYAGHTGVTLFFILSAFLLGLPFLQEAYGGRPLSRRQFYLRRVLRIIPLYYAAVIAGTLVTSRSIADLGRGVPYLLFFESHPKWVTPMQPWSDVWWSLMTEMQFYAVLPLVALAFGRRRATTLALFGLYLVVYLALVMGWILPAVNPWARAMSVAGRSPIFLCGILAAWLWLRHGVALRARLEATRWLAAGGGDILLLLVLLGLGLLLGWTSWWGFWPLETSPWFLWHVLEGALWALVVLIILLVPLRSKVLLSNRVLARLGVLSYSIYVLHQPLFFYSIWPWRVALPQSGLGWTPYTAVWFMLAATLCVGLASLTYRWIERPFLIRKARLDAGPPVARARAA